MKVKTRQSLLDIAIKQHGSIEALFELASTNDISISDELDSGIELDVSDSVLSANVVEYFSVHSIMPATAITNDDLLQTIADEGIEYWAIEEDFIIS